MTNGLNIRAQIDAEGVKALLLMNGGGAVALLAFLPFALGKPEYKDLASAALWGLLLFQVGLVFAVVHNALRRKCSLIYQRHQMNPPRGNIMGIKLGEPTVCAVSNVSIWLSIVMFMLASTVVFFGGRATLDQLPDRAPQAEVSHSQVETPKEP